MLRGKRDLASKIMHYSGILKFVSCYRKIIPKNWLTILAYHRMFDHSCNEHFDFDDALISASKEDFENQVKWLKKHFNITSFEALSKEEAIPSPLIITFDDGYKDNYELAYPVLKKHNLPATIFLSSGYIGENKLFWWDEISYLIKKTPKNKICIYINGQTIEYILNTATDRINTINSLLKLVKQVSDKDRKIIVSYLRNNTEVTIPNIIAEDMILNWAEIREMSKNGIEFGSHSVNHPILSNVSSAEVLQYEMEESKKIIEQETGKRVIVFSYPVGGNASFDERSKPLLQQAGYLYAATYVHGINKMPNLDKYSLKRIHIEKDDNIASFKSKIIFPNLIRY